MKKAPIFRTVIIAFFTAVVLFATAPDAFAQRSAAAQRAMNLLEFGNPEEAIAVASAAVTANAKDHEAWAALGIAYLESGNVAEAEKAVAKAFDLDRKNGLVRIARGKLYGIRGELKDALEEFNLAIKYEKNDLDAYLALSRYYMSIDSLKAAEVNLYRAQNANPNDVRSYMGLAEHFEKQKVYPLAIKQLEEAKKLDATSLPVRARLAQLYYRRREYTKSVNEWIDLMRIDSTYKKGYYEIANLFFLGEQFGNAASFAEKYVQLEPNDCKGHWLYARALVENNEFAKALPPLEFVAKCSDSLKLYTDIFRARGYVYTKEFGKANEIFSSAKNLEPKDVELWGTSLIYSGDTLGGVGKYKQSLVGDTIRSDSAKNLTKLRITAIYQGMKRYDLAGDFLSELAATEQSDTNYVKAGQLYMRAEKLAQAEDAFNKALARNPNSLSAYIGLIDVGTLRLDEAAIKAASEKAIALAQAPLYKNAVGEALGRAAFKFYSEKDYKKASSWFPQSVPLLSSESKYIGGVYLGWGATLIQLKQYDKAREVLKKAQTLDPDNEDIKKQLKFLDDVAAASGKPKK